MMQKESRNSCFESVLFEKEVELMGSKLYVGNLSFTMTDQDLQEAFSEFGEIVSATVVKDRSSGRSRGFGFVEFSNEESAQSAKDAMDGKEVKGRKLKVDEAKEQRHNQRSGDEGRRWRS
jgi:RNA recognition motif-containing protein